ncbi:Hypothetical protein SMAX5B_019346 [Scophthalmus maximus]|uniref:Uncharacterized protein n=1 Tax=Scophthalmus maximus TaxID=52904 RepID=A0A2U9BTZ3_SCOMX|nr:Hypothetical protein SMAX5B_019346 [Scophthalmus maximus]
MECNHDDYEVVMTMGLSGSQQQQRASLLLVCGNRRSEVVTVKSDAFIRHEGNQTKFTDSSPPQWKSS